MTSWRAPATGADLHGRALVVLVLTAVLVTSVATWVAASRIRSPASVAARTAAPDPSPILVPAEQRVVASRIVTRGTGHFGSPRPIVVAPSDLAPAAAVVTSLSAPGTVAAEGDVILTLSGRPVIILIGEVPSHRDLGPGMSGRDVAQLEAALARLGLGSGDVDGTYDARTEDGVKALYGRMDQAPVIADAGQLDELLPATSDLVAGGRPGPGVLVPASEVVFVPSLPLRVTEHTVAVGARPDGPLLTVTDSSVTVDGALPVEQAGLVQVGAAVTIDEPALGIRATGRVSHVAEQPGTDGVDGFHVYLEVAVDDAPPALIGASVRLTIPTETTGEPVLAVPVSALTMTGDGSSRVEVMRDGVAVLVTVEPGLAADGYVAIRVIDGDLVPGDLVVVGFDVADVPDPSTDPTPAPSPGATAPTTTPSTPDGGTPPPATTAPGSGGGDGT